MIQENIWFVIGLYTFICFVVAATCGNRGWGFGEVFIICLLTSPIIGAILFAPYKQTQRAATPQIAEVEEIKEDPALSNLIDHLEKKSPAHKE